MDSKLLYQEVILDHNRKPRNWGRLPAPSHKAEGLNPLCGDHIWLTVNVADGRVSEIAFEGEGCAICKASASMMTTNVKGKTLDEAERLVREFRDMATGKLDDGAPSHLGRLTVFAGVRNLPSRVKCAILPWHTLQAAFTAQGSVSTEGDADPVAQMG
jgi:nitrogen fixation NifU-like protein